MNLKNIKLESYVSIACCLFAMFSKIALVIAIILQFHIVSMLQQDSQSTTLFKRYVIAFLANIAYIVGLAFVNPSISASAVSFYVGFAVAIVSAPILLINAVRFAKEVAIIANNRLFLAIIGFVVVEFFAGLVWVLSYLWHWISVAHGFRNMDSNALAIAVVGVFVVSLVLIIAVFFSDEIRITKTTESEITSNKSNDTTKSNESNESIKESSNESKADTQSSEST